MPTAAHWRYPGSENAWFSSAFPFHNCKNEKQDFPCHGVLKCSECEDYSRIKTFPPGTEQTPVWTYFGWYMALLRPLQNEPLDLLRNYFFLECQETCWYRSAESIQNTPTIWHFRKGMNFFMPLECFLVCGREHLQHPCCLSGSIRSSFCTALCCMADIHQHREYIRYGKKLAFSIRDGFLLMPTVFI